MSQDIIVRSNHLDGTEVSWFAPICNDDYRYLGVPEDQYKSTFNHTKDILLTAEKFGFRNILCPSSYQVGQDPLAFAAAVAPMTSRINLLIAIRCGEFYPPMLGRYLASLDHILNGRLTINIISSDMPGEKLSSEKRYQRSREAIEILKQGFQEERVGFKGEFYSCSIANTDPVKPYQSGGPLFYFGGYSDHALKLCAEHCDVYLMWPDREEVLLNQMHSLGHFAFNEFDRKLDYGLRVHMIVRETEKEAKEYAQSLVSKLDIKHGEKIRNRALDAKSKGVSLQSDLREQADSDGYAEPLLWTGVGKARSGCGAALVGTPEQIVAKLKKYQDMGIRAFIFSSYPHKEECEMVGKYIIPHLKTISLAQELGRIPDSAPATPLAEGKRI
ncbi:MAG: LLM class flavin-dependent oxidoreductase [Oligoflexales bacterium]